LKKIFIFIVLILLPAASFAADPAKRGAHWSLEVKGGIFLPEIENWSTYYQRRDAGTYGGTLAYKVLPQLELGAGGRYIRAKGQGDALEHGTITGEVEYELAPLNLFVLARAVFSDNQWLIPYAGGGWTRMFYRTEVIDQSVARGYADGYHARAGLQLVLDAMDPYAAHRMYADYGVNHTSFFIEAEYIRAMADTATSGGSVDLGGKSFLAGLLFEF
jgi:hypothetical protein